MPRTCLCVYSKYCVNFVFEKCSLGLPRTKTVCGQMNVLHMQTDYQYTYHLLLNTITGKTKMCTKADREILIRRRLHTLLERVKKYDLLIDITQFNSVQNRADNLTWVSRRWPRQQERKLSQHYGMRRGSWRQRDNSDPSTSRYPRIKQCTS